MRLIERGRCVRCKRRMLGKSGWDWRDPKDRLNLRRSGWARTEARGLCSGCYSTIQQAGKLADYERITRSNRELLTEWAMLKQQGYSIAQAADRLGVTRDAIEAAMKRRRAAA